MGEVGKIHTTIGLKEKKKKDYFINKNDSQFLNTKPKHNLLYCNFKILILV